MYLLVDGPFALYSKYGKEILVSLVEYGWSFYLISSLAASSAINITLVI